MLATNESVRAVAEMRGGKSCEDVYVVRTAPKIVVSAAGTNESLRCGRRFLVGYIGVMGNADGVHLLLAAIHHLVVTRGRKDVQFLLMGTGPEHAMLLEQRRELGLDDFVAMPGRVSDEFLFAALKTMDLGVSSDPSNDYNDHCTMNKVLEYMAFGKPQVMFDLTEGRASAETASAYVTENDPQRLGEVIGELLDDPQRRERMGKAGARRLKNELNWERSVDQLLKAYRAALR